MGNCRPSIQSGLAVDAGRDDRRRWVRSSAMNVRWRRRAEESLGLVDDPLDISSGSRSAVIRAAIPEGPFGLARRASSNWELASSSMRRALAIAIRPGREGEKLAVAPVERVHFVE
jgi:hypothetical protein